MRFAKVAFLSILLLPGVAHADGEVQRLLDAKRTLAWNAAAGKGQRYGHAEALVDATADKVRDTALDFAHYKDLHRKLQNARVVGKDENGTDVYMKLPVKIGPFSFEQWSVMRFGPARALPGGGWVVEGRETKGNMKDGHLVITVRPVDAKHALLKVDLLLVPSMPAPQSMIDEELRDAAVDFANGLKDRSQGWVGPVVRL
jgi:hypothetical protein